MGLAVHAQPIFDIPQNIASVALSQELEYFIDVSGRWRPETGEPAPGGWQKLRDRAGQSNFGFLSHPVWLRVTLRSPITLERIWIIDTPQLDWVEWVQTRADRPPRQTIAGLGTLREGHASRDRVPSLPLTLDANQPVTVHLRVQGAGLMQVPVDLWEPAAWHERERRTLALLGSYFGLLVGLLAYNGFLALRLRDLAYSLYVGFGIGLGVFQLGSTGLGPHFVWTDMALNTHVFMSTMTDVYGAFALLFTDSFLHLGRRSPRLSWLLRGTAAVWGLLLLAQAWVPTPTIMNGPTLPLALWTVLLIMIAGVRGVLQKTPAATYFLLGWSGLVAAVVPRVLLRMGLLPPHPVLYNSLLIASALEMLLLSLALADRITEERRARTEADLQRAREQVAREEAQRALQEKTRFMAAITHDLQQPIYALSLATESVVRRRTEALSTEALNQIQSAVFAADELLSSLAMNVRLERDDLQPDTEVFSVQEMLERIDTLFVTLAQQRGLRWRVLPSLSQVRSNPLLLERMVCNLVSNAMRYTSAGGVLLSCRSRSGHLLIQIWDTGPGIPAHEQAFIFEPHYRGNAAQAHDKGLGLGLSIVSRCARLLDIRVGLRSVQGRGSCFELWVPLAPSP
ncbi:sensor histidine kinase [Hydrogenophaga sp.]|uniref:sensor histidine kinase n=1 Tax=Hydrogenophaga sp. TaxID=1904254 RepID=UPI002FC5B2B3